jgi:hypothetical protein
MRFLRLRLVRTAPGTPERTPPAGRAFPVGFPPDQTSRSGAGDLVAADLAAGSHVGPAFDEALPEPGGDHPGVVGIDPRSLSDRLVRGDQPHEVKAEDPDR